MTSTIKQISIATLLTAMFFVAAFSIVGNASAYVTGGGGTGCTDCGGGNDDGSTPTPTPTTPGGNGGSTPIIPVCDLNAKPATINEGASSKLSWTSRNAISGVINQGVGEVNPNNKDGVRNVSPAQTKVYTLTVRSITGKTATCSAKVTVIPKPELPTCVLKAAPTQVAVNGASVLSWTTTNAISGVINQGVGPVDPKNTNATESVTVAQNTTYTMTVKNAAGNTATCSKTITVTENPLAPECKSFSASPTRITRGNSTNLAWETVRATSISIDNAVGTVIPTAAGSVSVKPIQTTTYKATVVGNGGTVSCPVTVIVDTPNNDTFTCENNVNFSASATSIREGNSTTLTWDTRGGVDSVRINNGVNSTALDGSESVSPRSDTTYTLTATKGSNTVNCPLTINVDEDNGGGGGGGGSSSPKCSLKISDNKISLGERVTLKWDTTRATEVTIKDNHGKTLIDTDDKSSSEKKDLYDGEITIRPEKDTTYTLVAEKGSRDKTCKVSVDVEDTIVVTQIRDQQPLVTGIALTQVPYTGFEAGPFMTSVFYTLLAAWALYMAYVLVGRRNGVDASAFTPARVLSEVVPAQAMFPAAVTAAPVFYQAPEPVVASTATVGYEAHVEVAEALEAQAHAAHVLLSSDAVTYFVAATANENRTEILSGVLAAAKASYPSEDGWVVISADRMMELASKY